MKAQNVNKYIYIVFLFVIAISIIMPAMSVSAKKIGGKTRMQTYADAMNPGWNLGNTLDATGVETSWGNPLTTKEFIKTIASQGYKSIRIPITWKHRVGDAPDYLIKPEFLQRVQEVVDWSLDAGLYVMINLHHDSGGWIMKMETEHDEVTGRFNSIWRQISKHFKDYPDTLMFESVNEPRFSDDWSKDTPEYFEMLDELNISFQKIVRKSGGNNVTRPLVLPTLTCSASQNRLDELNKTISKLNDKNIIATIHYYGYWPFSVNIAGSTTFNDVVRKDLETTFDRAFDTFVANGIPVIVGEVGILGFDKSYSTIQHGEVLKYFEYVTYYTNKKNQPLMLWDNGQHFDRRNSAWRDPKLYELMMVSLKERSSYTERDSIYIKNDTQIRDVKMKLTLNGNALVDIKSGDNALVKGTDYDIDGEALIFKSSLLEKLITTEYGINATLTCEFSKGVDWIINIIYYDTPILKSSGGVTTGFTIPASFNGDSLATMEAVYTGGGNAGPNDWTPFKEFNHSFTPLYAYNQIKLTKEFLNEVNDGEILLKMHFWSGEIVEYKILKDGVKVTGMSSAEPEKELIADKPADDKHKNDNVNDQSKGDGVDETFAQKPANNTAPDGGKSTLLFLITGGIAAIIIAAGIGIYIKLKV